jgi:hypothetical protein
LVYDWAMSRRGYQACSRKSAWAAGALFLFGLAGCEPFWSAPEGRALDFVEALVTAPADMQKLRNIANLAPDRNPEDLLDGLSARVALDFLRAKQGQGVALKFALGEAKQIDAVRRAVSIRVSYLQPGTPANSEVRMQVQIEKDNQGRWRITRVTGDN